MPASKTEAVNDIMDVVSTAWTASAVPLGFEPLLFEDNAQSVPKEVDGSGDLKQWGRAEIRHFTGFESALRRGAGLGRYTQLGQVVVRIYTRGGDGRRDSDTLAHAIQVALQGTCTTNGVIFRQVSGNEAGQSGPWFQVNVQANFEYDIFS